jgi:hypothetical protein
VLAIEMAKALVAGDRARFTALAATREEMEAMLEAAQPPSRPEDRQEMKAKVAEIVADRRGDFDSFQAMKKAARRHARRCRSVRGDRAGPDVRERRDEERSVTHACGCFKRRLAETSSPS